MCIYIYYIVEKIGFVSERGYHFLGLEENEEEKTERCFVSLLLLLSKSSVGNGLGVGVGTVVGVRLGIEWIIIIGKWV